MPVEPGQRLLHFELGEKIGEGGMGAVWRATDTTLGREVAIKIVPPTFADDPDRLARFEREAKTLASLNHPNIAQIYGLHEAATDDGSVRFLSMEFVEGEDLSKRLARGPMSVEQALDIGAQMAAGIEAAHERGVVHRDLKPANAILTPEGRVKLLDFGLAKALEPDPAGSDPSLSPTMTSLGTVAGVILGTAAYMSPEQARGRPVDRRTDLWSFGCVLYECLAGTSLFAGETVSDSLAAVLRKDPDFDRLPARTPPLVKLMLRRCLARDPDRRLRDAGDARLELQQAIEDPDGHALGLAPASDEAVTDRSRSTRLAWSVAAVALVAFVVLTIVSATRDPAGSEVRIARHVAIPVDGTPSRFDDIGGSPPAVSPDGRFVVVGLVDERGVEQLWLRPIDRFDATRLPGTENAAFPFWSPDGRHVGFFYENRIRRVEIATGRVQTIIETGPTIPRGASWGVDGTIVYAPNSNSGVWAVDASGGEPWAVTEPDPDIPDGSHRWPTFLPDGKRFLFTLWTNDTTALERHGGIHVGWLDGSREPVRVLPDPSSAAYAPSGHLLLVQEGHLLAVPFDAERLAVEGQGVIVADGVLRNSNNGFAVFSVSREGTLVLTRGVDAIPETTLTWVDREGNRTPTPVEPTAMFEWLALSPDDRRAAVLMPGPTGDGEVWIIDLERGVRTRLVTPASWGYHDPIWSEDGRRVLYVSSEKGSWDLYVRNADGSGIQEPVLVSGFDKSPYDLHDGRLLYWSSGAGNLSSQTRLYDPATDESVVLQDIGIRIEARFSPDGSFFVYSYAEDSRREVFVQSIASGARWQLSTAGGSSPNWSDDGTEIVYESPDGTLMSVAVRIDGDRIAFDRPEILFRLDGSVTAWDARGDHRRFLLAERPTRGHDPLLVILDWEAGLRAGED